MSSTIKMVGVRVASSSALSQRGCEAPPEVNHIVRAADFCQCPTPAAKDLLKSTFIIGGAPGKQF